MCQAVLSTLQDLALHALVSDFLFLPLGGGIRSFHCCAEASNSCIY